MNLTDMIYGFVGANSFAHNLLFVRMNSHLQKQYDALSKNHIRHQCWILE